MDGGDPSIALGYLGYEVQYILQAPASAVDALRTSLAGLGDSVTVAGIEPTRWNVHVHVDDVGAAIEAGMQAGRPSEIRVTRLVHQKPLTVRSRTTLLVALDGPELLDLFDQVAAAVVVIDPASGDIDNGTAQLQAAVLNGPNEMTAAARCLVLPTDERLTELARRVAATLREQGIEVAVVPCRSPVQAIAAIAVHDDARRDEDDLIAMAEAAASTRFARIEVAAGPGLTSIGPCQAGDVLGLIDGDVVEIGSAAAEVTLQVVARLLGIGGELMTVVLDGGPGAIAGLDDSIRRHVAEHAPLVELTIHRAGALACVALLGME